MADAETVDLYTEAESQVRDVLIRYRRARAITRGAAALRLEPDSGSHTPDPCRKSVPSDRLCWTLDVGRLLRSMDDPHSVMFVHPCASSVLLADLVEGLAHKDIHERTGCKRREIGMIVEGAVEMFFAHYLAIALEYEPAA